MISIFGEGKRKIAFSVYGGQPGLISCLVSRIKSYFGIFENLKRGRYAG